MDTSINVLLLKYYLKYHILRQRSLAGEERLKPIVKMRDRPNGKKRHQKASKRELPETKHTLVARNKTNFKW